MARKAILEGGKRDEIIYAAMKLFFENGYEATSVRMILDQVGGEVGMFYHYFKSKDELFQKVVDRFFADYQVKFSQLTDHCDSKEQMAEKLLTLYDQSMEEFHKLSPNLHWTIQFAMSGRTIYSLRPAVEQLIQKWGYKQDLPADIVAGQLLFALSATLHAESFNGMSQEEKYRTLRQCLDVFL